MDTLANQYKCGKSKQAKIFLRFLLVGFVALLIVLSYFGKTLIVGFSLDKSSIPVRSPSDKQPSPLQPEQPRQHIYYLKTHKTGSTTMFSILGEYCRVHDLMPLLPRDCHINQSPPFDENQLLLTDAVAKYDMVFNHHIFTPAILSYLKSDMFTLTTLRDPFKNFVSAFNYYRTKFHLEYLMLVKGEDPLMKFLLHPDRYNPLGYKSFTNNRQSMDLGYNISHSFNDLGYIEEFIKLTEERFDLVLITEFFDESLVIMKRVLHWNTQDIIYLTKNKGPDVETSRSESLNSNSTREELQRKLHSKFSTADIMLYDYFLKRFKNLMRKEVGLDEEVVEFRQILQKIRDYCKNVNNMTENVVIPRGKWCQTVYISPFKCTWMSMQEGEITKNLKQRQALMLNNG